MALPPWEDIEEGTTLISRLQSWLVKQPNCCARVSDAAAQLGVRRERIEQAAMDGYWLGIDKRDGEQFVFADGE